MHPYQIDNSDFFDGSGLLVPTPDDYIELSSNIVTWADTLELRRPGLLAVWVNNDARRNIHAERMSRLRRSGHVINKPLTDEQREQRSERMREVWRKRKEQQ